MPFEMTSDDGVLPLISADQSEWLNQHIKEICCAVNITLLLCTVKTVFHYYECG